MQAVIAHAWEQLAQFAYDPALTAIQEGDPLTKIADSHSVLVEGAHLRGGRLGEHPELARSHSAPASFVLFYRPHQLPQRPAPSCRGALMGGPQSDTLRFKQ